MVIIRKMIPDQKYRESLTKKKERCAIPQGGQSKVKGIHS